MKLLLATCRGRATAAAAAIRELIGADRNKESRGEEVLSLSKHIDQLSVLEMRRRPGGGGGGGGYETPRQVFAGLRKQARIVFFLFDFYYLPFFCESPSFTVFPTPECETFIIIIRLSFDL